MSTALALTSCEAQIAAAGGQGIQSAAGRAAAPDTAEGFKKQLEDCEAMVVPMQQPAAVDGSNPNAEDGKQLSPGVMQGLSGISCVFEGIEVPGLPSDVAEAQGQAVDMPPTMIPGDGMPEKSLAEGPQADSTPESNAWMQQTEAGGTLRTPGLTQDQIVETVGAYVDAAANAGPEKPGPQVQQTVPAQAAAPQEGQDQAVTNAATGTAVTGETDAPMGVPGGESQSAVPKPAAPVSGQTSEYAGTDTQNSAAADPSASPGEQSENTAMGRAEHTAADTAGNAMADKAESVVKRAQVKADAPEESGKTQAAVPAADRQQTAPAAKEAPVKTVPQSRAEEAAQYTKENVLRIVDRVSTQAKEGRYDFDVQLKPEFLGKVNIRLTMEDGVIRLQVKTDDMSVRGMLSDQASSLQDALKEKGITLSSVDVTYESQASLDGGKQPFEQNDGGRRQGSLYYAHTEAAGYEPAAEPYRYYVGNSSVEYLA